MKRLNAISFLILLLFPGMLLAQAAGNSHGISIPPPGSSPQPGIPTPRASKNIRVSEPNQSGIVLEADVMINIQASSYVVIFSATQNGPTAKEADSLMNHRIQTLMNGISTLEIPSEQIHVDAISMVPVYDVEFVNKTFSNTANEVPTGFQIKKNIHVIFTDHRALDQIITAAARAEIYDIVKVDYNVDNINAAYDTLRKVAISIIEKNRELYTDLGLQTTVVNLADGKSCTYPAERYASYTAYQSGSSMQTAEKKNPNVEIKQVEKIETIYYDKIPYNQFDMVLNADMVEPAIQFFYKLKVRYLVSPIELTPSESERDLSAR